MIFPGDSLLIKFSLVNMFIQIATPGSLLNFSSDASVINGFFKYYVIINVLFRLIRKI